MVFKNLTARKLPQDEAAGSAGGEDAAGKAAREERYKFLLVPGEGHATDMLYCDEILAQIEAFIRKNQH